MITTKSVEIVLLLINLSVFCAPSTKKVEQLGLIRPGNHALFECYISNDFE